MNKHAELMKQYAQDWAATNEPWTLWQFRDMDSIVTIWMGLEAHPKWSQNAEYRRKPQTRTITLPPANGGDAIVLIAAYNSNGIRLADFDLGYFEEGQKALEYLERLKDELK